MEYSNIDKLFKNKLEHREVTFRDAYWAAAEKLIAEEERKKRRRRFGWWLLLLPLVVGGFCLVLYWSPATADLPSFQKNTLMETVSPSDGSQTRSENTTEQATSQLPPNTESTPENTLLEKTDATLVPANTTTTADPSGFPKGEQPATFPAPALNTPANTGTNKQPVRQKPQAHQLPATHTNVPAELIRDREDEKLVSDNTVTGLNPSEEKPHPLNAGIQAIAQLELPVLDLLLEASDPAPKSVIKKCKTQRFRWGATGSIISAFDGSISNYRFSGANAGLSFNYRFHPRWSVNADLLYEFRRKHAVFPNGSDTLKTNIRQYSFGIEDREVELVLNHAHRMVIPITARYHFGRHLVEAGGQIAYVFGLKGALTDQTSSPLADEESDSKNTWLNLKGFNPFELGAVAGYRFKLSDQLNVGLRVVWNPGKKAITNEISDSSGSQEDRFGGDGPWDPYANNGVESVEPGSSPQEENNPDIPLAISNSLNFQLGAQYFFGAKPRYTYKPLLEL